MTLAAPRNSSLRALKSAFETGHFSSHHLQAQLGAADAGTPENADGEGGVQPRRPSAAVHPAAEGQFSRPRGEPPASLPCQCPYCRELLVQRNTWLLQDSSPELAVSLLRMRKLPCWCKYRMGRLGKDCHSLRISRNLPINLLSSQSCALPMNCMLRTSFFVIIYHIVKCSNRGCAGVHRRGAGPVQQRRA